VLDFVLEVGNDNAIFELQRLTRQQ